MDGVIIDVSASYRDVVRRTAGLYFQPARGSQRLPDPLFELADLAAIKQSGGLNNDWDLTYEVISLLASLVDFESPGTREHHDPWSRYREVVGKCDVSSMADFLRSTDRPLVSLLKQHGRCNDKFVKSTYAGNVGSGNIIKQIFQEIYLGESLFRSTYSLNAETYAGEGFILREKVLIDRKLLKDLAAENTLAIATGRPRAEAEYPLKHFQLNRFFSQMLTLDDCLSAEKHILEQEGRTVSLSKPDPFMLDAVVRKYPGPFDNCYYIGDMPDDMLAAAASETKFKGIGIVLSAPDRQSLQKDLSAAGADYIIDSFDGLKEIIL